MAKQLTKSQRLKRKGLWYFFGGAILTIGTVSLARGGGGGVYVLAWGPILFGPIIYFRGVMLQGEPEDTVEKDEPAPISPSTNKCPSCGTSFSSNQEYCSVCGRSLKF